MRYRKKPTTKREPSASTVGSQATLRTTVGPYMVDQRVLREEEEEAQVGEEELVVGKGERTEAEDKEVGQLQRR